MGLLLEGWNRDRGAQLPASLVSSPEGDRTPDPQTASLMLSQLSYSPTSDSNYRWAGGLSKALHGTGRALWEVGPRLNWMGRRLKGWAGREVLGIRFWGYRGVVSCGASGRSGEIGIRRGLKIPRLHGRAGSNPASGTTGSRES